MNEKKDNALVPRPPSAVEKAGSGPKRILSGMVTDTLALVKREQYETLLLERDYLNKDTSKPIPPRVLKRLEYLLSMKWYLQILKQSDSQIKSSQTKLRIGGYEWYRPDYCQILNWAICTGLTPKEVILNLLDQRSLHEWERFKEPLFADGRLLKVNLDLSLFPRGKLVWTSGLEITHLRFISSSEATGVHDIGQMPLSRLEALFCRRLGLTHLNLKTVPQLQFLDCRYNQLEKLRFDQTPNLRYLYCANNTISELDLSSCPNLKEVDCSENPTSVLDIRGLKNLRVLNRSPHTKVLMDPEQEHTVQDLEAQFQMAMSICYGKDLHQDYAYAEGARLLRSAAEKGHSSAQAYLGDCYYEGLGVPQDYIESEKWFRKAADQGDAHGQYGLGLQYNNGLGVPKDYAEAVKWYRKAAEQGHTGGQNNLGVCYWNGLGVPQDYNESEKWFRKAAERGDAHGQNNLGLFYGYGPGVPKDAIEAYKWFKLAAEQGQKDAAKELDSLTSRLSADEQQEGDRRYREFKASHLNLLENYRGI